MQEKGEKYGVKGICKDQNERKREERGFVKGKMKNNKGKVCKEEKGEKQKQSEESEDG